MNRNRKFSKRCLRVDCTLARTRPHSNCCAMLVAATTSNSLFDSVTVAAIITCICKYIAWHNACKYTFLLVYKKIESFSVKWRRQQTAGEKNGFFLSWNSTFHELFAVGLMLDAFLRAMYAEHIFLCSFFNIRPLLHMNSDHFFVVGTYTKIWFEIFDDLQKESPRRLHSNNLIVHSTSTLERCYCRLTASNKNSKPFQHAIILIKANDLGVLQPYFKYF